LWSPQQIQDVDSMYTRLAAVNQELEQLGLRQRSNMGVMLARMAGTEDIAALRVLAEAVEPVSITIREKEAESAGGIQTSDIALDRMVDAVAPESEAARRFSVAVDQFVGSNFQNGEAKAEIRSALVAWRDNDAALQPLLQNSFLLKEISPVSKNLSAFAAAGLQALDYIEKKERAPEGWHAEQIALAQTAAKPTADLNLAIVPAVQKLIEASAGAR
jgi:hexosaminidase